MSMTRKERQQRDAAFELLLEDMRGWRKRDGTSGETDEWTRGPASERASESVAGRAGRTVRQSVKRGLHGEIVAARVRRGWTQEELAHRTGTTQSAIARLESGQAQPRMRTLQKLAEALGARLVVRLEVD
jgi:ribosome-binding protein aMBF1 (putative translation factor)